MNKTILKRTASKHVEALAYMHISCRNSLDIAREVEPMC